MSSDQLASALRQSDPAVLPRIKQDAVLLDLRTVRPESDTLLKEIVESKLAQANAKQAGTYQFANGTT
jgi:hypothetical protein